MFPNNASVAYQKAIMNCIIFSSSDCTFLLNLDRSILKLPIKHNNNNWCWEHIWHPMLPNVTHNATNGFQMHPTASKSSRELTRATKSSQELPRHPRSPNGIQGTFWHPMAPKGPQGHPRAQWQPRVPNGREGHPKVTNAWCFRITQALLKLILKSFHRHAKMKFF